jgi:alpha-glucuronidase
MHSGRPLWDELVYRYTHGVDAVREMRKTWDEVGPLVDAERREQVATFLRIQEKEAMWWRDACVAYFQTFSQQPIPSGAPPPEHSLDYYKSLSFPYAPGH